MSGRGSQPPNRPVAGFQTMDEIETIPPSGLVGLSFVMTVLMFAAAGMFPILLLIFVLMYYFGGPYYKLPHWLIAPVFLAAATPGFLTGIWLAKRTSKKAYWRLTPKDLLCGPRGEQRFPLSSIEKLIVGLPVERMSKFFQKAQPGTVAGTSVAALATVDPRLNTVKALWQARGAKENSILICFKNGSMLPLRIFALPNGSAIMEELKRRFKDRLIDDYNYSPEEIRRLRGRDANELIPAPKKL